MNLAVGAVRPAQEIPQEGTAVRPEHLRREMTNNVLKYFRTAMAVHP